MAEYVRLFRTDRPIRPFFSEGPGGEGGPAFLGAQANAAENEW